MLTFSVFLGGCSHSEQTDGLIREKKVSRQTPEVVVQENESPKQTPEVASQEKESRPMIQIQNFSLTDKTLTLDYRASNPFEDDIWVCHDISVYGKQDVQHAATRINNETLRIQLRRNIERFPGFQNPWFIAKYIRIKPRESYSGKIVRHLPVKDYVREWREYRKEHKEIDLNRAVFEVDYFGSKRNKFLDLWPERFKNKPIKPELRIVGPYYYLSISPLITEEKMDDQLCEVMYLGELDPFLKNEKFKEIVLTDISIPCSVVVDDK